MGPVVHVMQLRDQVRSVVHYQRDNFDHATSQTTGQKNGPTGHRYGSNFLRMIEGRSSNTPKEDDRIPYDLYR